MYHQSTPPWWALCIDLIGPYTLNSKDGTSIDFMCLTMIDPAMSWVWDSGNTNCHQIDCVPTISKGKKVTCDNYTKESETTFDKSSAQISNLVYETWFSRYPHCQHSKYDNRSNFKLHFRALCNTYGIKHKPTSVKFPQENAVLEHIHAVFMNRYGQVGESQWHWCLPIRCSMGHLLYPPYST